MDRKLGSVCQERMTASNLYRLDGAVRSDGNEQLTDPCKLIRRARSGQTGTVRTTIFRVTSIRSCCAIVTGIKRDPDSKRLIEIAMESFGNRGFIGKTIGTTQET